MNKEILEIIKQVPEMLRIVERQGKLILIRAKDDVAGCGTFGIAVKDDPAAKEWQSLEKQRSDFLEKLQKVSEAPCSAVICLLKQSDGFTYTATADNPEELEYYKTLPEFVCVLGDFRYYPQYCGIR